jgi:hypothetical protein
VTNTGSAVSLALDPSVLLGDWHNNRDASGGILRILVTGHDEGARVRAFGTGSLEPRDWGETQACTYAAQASSPTATAFTASYDFGFLRNVMYRAHFYRPDGLERP